MLKSVLMHFDSLYLYQGAFDFEFGLIVYAHSMEHFFLFSFHFLSLTVLLFIFFFAFLNFFPQGSLILSHIT